MTAFVLDNQERITVRSAGEHHLDVEIEFPPHCAAPPLHVHPRQAVRFEILAGAVHATCRHEESVLRRGELLDIQAGAPHRLWNEELSPARALCRTTPPGRTLEWLEVISGIERRHGRRDLSAYLVALAKYDDVYRFDLRPHFAAQAAVTALAPVLRLWMWARPAQAG